VASGFRFQTQADLGVWIQKLGNERPPRYSRALLETLALIAYRQPITRAEIEAVRGVAVNTPTIKTLMERNWVQIAGYRDVPGKPALYATTKEFLDYFNLSRLSDLAALSDVSEVVEVIEAIDAVEVMEASDAE
jgi:segregation and condensation protein B